MSFHVSLGETIVSLGILYLKGQVDLVSRLMAPITHLVTLPIPIMHPPTKSP